MIFHHFWDAMAHITELVWGKPLYGIRSPFHYLRIFSATYGVAMSIFDFIVTYYLNVPHVKPEKGVSGPLKATYP